MLAFTIYFIDTLVEAKLHSVGCWYDAAIARVGMGPFHEIVNREYIFITIQPVTNSVCIRN